MPALPNEMQASSALNFRYLSCLLDKGHISFLFSIKNLSNLRTVKKYLPFHLHLLLVF